MEDADISYGWEKSLDTRDDALALLQEKDERIYRLKKELHDEKQKNLKLRDYISDCASVGQKLADLVQYSNRNERGSSSTPNSESTSDISPLQDVILAGIRQLAKANHQNALMKRELDQLREKQSILEENEDQAVKYKISGRISTSSNIVSFDDEREDVSDSIQLPLEIEVLRRVVAKLREKVVLKDAVFGRIKERNKVTSSVLNKRLSQLKRQRDESLRVLKTVLLLLESNTSGKELIDTRLRDEACSMFRGGVNSSPREYSNTQANIINKSVRDLHLITNELVAICTEYGREVRVLPKENIFSQIRQKLRFQVKKLTRCSERLGKFYREHVSVNSFDRRVNSGHFNNDTLSEVDTVFTDDKELSTISEQGASGRASRLDFMMMEKQRLENLLDVMHGKLMKLKESLEMGKNYSIREEEHIEISLPKEIEKIMKEIGNVDDDLTLSARSLDADTMNYIGLSSETKCPQLDSLIDQVQQEVSSFKDIQRDNIEVCSQSSTEYVVNSEGSSTDDKGYGNTSTGGSTAEGYLDHEDITLFDSQSEIITQDNHLKEKENECENIDHQLRHLLHTNNYKASMGTEKRLHENLHIRHKEFEENKHFEKKGPVDKQLAVGKKTAEAEGNPDYPTACETGIFYWRKKYEEQVSTCRDLEKKNKEFKKRMESLKCNQGDWKVGELGHFSVGGKSESRVQEEHYSRVDLDLINTKDKLAKALNRCDCLNEELHLLSVQLAHKSDVIDNLTISLKNSESDAKTFKNQVERLQKQIGDDGVVVAGAKYEIEKPTRKIVEEIQGENVGTSTFSTAHIMETVRALVSSSFNNLRTQISDIKQLALHHRDEIVLTPSSNVLDMLNSAYARTFPAESLAMKLQDEFPWETSFKNDQEIKFDLPKESEMLVLYGKIEEIDRLSHEKEEDILSREKEIRHLKSELFKKEQHFEEISRELATLRSEKELEDKQMQGLVGTLQDTLGTLKSEVISLKHKEGTESSLMECVHNRTQQENVLDRNDCDKIINILCDQFSGTRAGQRELSVQVSELQLLCIELQNALKDLAAKNAIRSVPASETKFPHEIAQRNDGNSQKRSRESEVQRLLIDLQAWNSNLQNNCLEEDDLKQKLAECTEKTALSDRNVENMGLKLLSTLEETAEIKRNRDAVISKYEKQVTEKEELLYKLHKQVGHLEEAIEKEAKLRKEKENNWQESKLKLENELFRVSSMANGYRNELEELHKRFMQYKSRNEIEKALIVDKVDKSKAEYILVIKSELSQTLKDKYALMSKAQEYSSSLDVAQGKIKVLNDDLLRNQEELKVARKEHLLVQTELQWLQAAIKTAKLGHPTKSFEPDELK